MSTDIPAVPINASRLPSPAHASGEGVDGPVRLDQSIPILPSGKDDAQVLSTSPTDTQSGLPNYSTYPTIDPPWQEDITALKNEVVDLKIRISYLESGGNSTLQTPVVTNDNNTVQQDDNTNPLKRPSGTPLSSDPTTSWFRQNHLTARISIRIACLFILVILLLQTFYALYTNLRDSRFWWSAAYDWCFATDACNTKVGTPLKEGYDVGLASISAFWGVVEMVWFHCLDTITPWWIWIQGVEHILLVCCIRMLAVRWPKKTSENSSVRDWQSPLRVVSQ